MTTPPIPHVTASTKRAMLTITHLGQPQGLLSHATPSSSPSLAAQHRLKKVISVHSDKTFSLVAQSGSASSATDSLRSPRYSSTVQSASYDLSSSDLLGEDRPSSPLTPLPELSSQDNSPISKYPGTASDSPWNYRFVGGFLAITVDPGGLFQLEGSARPCRRPSDTRQEFPQLFPVAINALRTIQLQNVHSCPWDRSRKLWSHPGQQRRRHL
ncbi:serine-rich protein [Purpureocillium lavendulum]|uniref:Serine-rich protein n=1 Tax=Purpureocillium lavendulum TaxID=1247861 RepID=A0AB34FTH9_9HYPO|nr:serine-rich protein [Purpureocillium lavendulum]